MSGFFGVASKEDCVLDVFLALITIPIWEQDVVEWRFTVIKVLEEQSIT